MIEPLKIEENSLSYKDFFVDLTKQMPEPDGVLYLAGDDGNFEPVMTRGEYSVIVGQSKSKKTFLKSLFASVMLSGGKVDNIFVKAKMRVADFDTEQGAYYSHRTFSRSLNMAKSRTSDVSYETYTLRKLSPQERLEIIESYLIEKGKKIDVLIVDGLADLLDDVNDLKMSNYVVSKLLKFTEEYNIHICTVLHKNFGSEKPTGHVGSATLKKAETVIFVEPIENSQSVKVICKYSRGRNFREFTMGIEGGIPYIDDYVSDDLKF